MALIAAVAVSAPEANAAAGDPDATYGSGGNGQVLYTSGLASRAYATALQADGKVLQGGADGGAPGTRFVVVRRATDGAIDAAWDGDGVAHSAIPGYSNADLAGLAVQPDGKVVAIGTAWNDPDMTSQRAVAARWNVDGTLDATFGSSGIVVSELPGYVGLRMRAVAVQGDGKLVVVGFAKGTNGIYEFVVMRYTSAGQLDATFGSSGIVTTHIGWSESTGSTGAFANGVFVRTDGRIVVGGYAQHSAMGRGFALARYMPDGSLDATFGNGGSVLEVVGASSSSEAYAVAQQADGAIVMAGEGEVPGGPVDPYTGEPSNLKGYGVARFTPEGALDGTFDGDGETVITIGDNDARVARALAVQPDGSILVAGNARALNTSDERMGLIRLTPSGAVDGDFGSSGRVIVQFAAAPSGAHQRSLLLQEDGRIVLGGWASDGTDYFALARLYGSGATFTATPATRLPGESVTFTRAANTSIVSQAWDLDDDGAYDDGTGEAASIAYATAGTRIVRLQATWSDGRVEHVVRHFRVRAVPSGTIAADPAAPLTGQETLMTAHITDPDGVVASLAWDTDGDGFDDGSGSTLPISWTTAGPKVVAVRAVDAEGDVGVVRRTVEVQNRAPVAALAAPSVNRREYTLTASAIDDGTSLEYAWDLDGNGTFGDDTGTGSVGSTTAVRSYPAGSTRVVSVRVTDEHGASGTASRTVTVTNAPPVASFGVDPAETPVERPVQFDGSGSSDADGAISSWWWDFDGDGTWDRTTYSAKVDFPYARQGAYTARLRVLDDDGGASEVVTRLVRVREAPVGPPVPSTTAGCTSHLALLSGRIDARSSCFRKVNGVWSSDTRVRVNGLDIYPARPANWGCVCEDAQGPTVLIDARQATRPHLTALGAVVSANHTSLYRGQLSWYLNEQLTLRVHPGIRFGQLAATGTATFTTGFSQPRICVWLFCPPEVPQRGRAGRAHVVPGIGMLTFPVKLPPSLGSVTGNGSWNLNTVAGGPRDAIKVAIPEAVAATNVPVRGAVAAYDDVLNQWTSTGKVDLGYFGMQDQAFTFTPGGGLDFSALSGLVDGMRDGIQLPFFSMQTYVSPPPAQQRITLDMLAGSDVMGQLALGIRGDVRHVFPHAGRQGHWYGDVRLRYVTTGADGKVAMWDDGGIAFDATLHSDVGMGIKLDGTLKGSLSGRSSYASGSGDTSWLGLHWSGSGWAMSDRGGAACASQFSLGFGLRWHWGKNPQLMAGCSAGKWVENLEAASYASVRTGFGGRGLQAGGGFSVPRGAAQVAIAADGAVAAPRVTLTTPGGRRIVAAATGRQSGGVTVLADSERRVMYVVITNPAPGRWSVEPAEGSSMTSLRTNLGDRPATITARVVRRGARRAVRFDASTSRSQRVRLIDRGAGRIIDLGIVAGRGERQLRAGSGHAGAREIVARVEQADGLPISERVVARYRLRVQPLAKPLLRVRRTRTRVTVTWRRVADARQYRVQVATSHGYRRSVTVAASMRSLPMPLVRGETAKVTVRALDAVGTPGRPGVAFVGTLGRTARGVRPA